MKMTSKMHTMNELHTFCDPIVARYDADQATGGRMAENMAVLLAAGLNEDQVAALSDLITSAHYCGKYVG